MVGHLVNMPYDMLLTSSIKTRTMIADFMHGIQNLFCVEELWVVHCAVAEWFIRVNTEKRFICLCVCVSVCMYVSMFVTTSPAQTEMRFLKNWWICYHLFKGKSFNIFFVQCPLLFHWSPSRSFEFVIVFPSLQPFL